MNAVFILSDRHTATFSGCYGNAITRTPNLDRLAERGTRFEYAYCLSPTCAPTRASMLTGRYMHEMGTWCNSFPYAGKPEGWGHTLRDRGVLYTTIGKLDYAPDVDCGIEDARLPSYRRSRDVLTLFREQNQVRYLFVQRFCETGPADSPRAYRADSRVAEEAARWIAEGRPADRPWVLSVNFSQLHRPWLPMHDLWDHYDPLVKIDDLDERYTEDLDHLHPYHRAFSLHTGGDWVSLEQVRRGLVGYHGACEVLDRHIGCVMDALERAGILEETLVVYSSDHGGNCGEHRSLDHGGLYEESARIPLVVAGPDVLAGGVEADPVSLIDVYPTICDAVGVDLPTDRHGASLMPILRGDLDAHRPNFALCQFHAAGFPGSGFAFWTGHDKYVECVGERPMLFDLQADPLEMHDLMRERPEDLDVQEKASKLRGMLTEICDPEAAAAQCEADQLALREGMIQSGLLLDELWKRGYERRADRLVPRQEVVGEARAVIGVEG